MGSGITCADPRGGGWFGRMTEQSPLTGYEPNNLIEISNEHTPITFLTRRTVSAPTSTTCPAPLPRLIPQTLWMREWFPFVYVRKRSGSSNPQQPASLHVMYERSCGKLQRCAHVVRKLREIATERLLWCWKILVEWKDRLWIGQCVFPRTRNIHVWMSQKQNLHDYLDKETWRALQGECLAQRELSEAEMERDGMIGYKRNSDWAGMYGMRLIAWKLMTFGDFAAKRRRELDNWEQMNFMLKRKKNLQRCISSCLRPGLCKTRWMPWMKRKSFTIRRQQAVERPTFPVNPLLFRVSEICIASILDCRTIHGIFWVH